MLDREAACSFLLDGDQPQAFFITEGIFAKEVDLADQETIIATAKLNEVEKEFGLPETTTDDRKGSGSR